MEQAGVSDSGCLDFRPLFDDGPVLAELNVGGDEIAEAFMVSAVVGCFDVAFGHPRLQIDCASDTFDNTGELY